MVERNREVLYRKNSPAYGGQLSQMLFDTLLPQGAQREVIILRSSNPDLLAELFKKLHQIDLRFTDHKESVHGLLGAIAESVDGYEEVEV